MTANEMAYSFDVRYDAISTLSLPGYIDSEKSLFLNLAQERLVKSYYNPEGNKYKKGFEGTEKRRKDLSRLVRTSVLPDGTPKCVLVPGSSGGLSSTSRYFTLPDDFWLSIVEWGFSKEDTTARPPKPLEPRYDVIPITHDEYNIQKSNPFNKPKCGKAWRLDITTDAGVRYHEIIADVPLVQYHVRYIKKMNNIVVNTEDPTTQVDSELDDTLHREIVDIAVELALETVADRRFQSMKIQNQNIE